MIGDVWPWLKINVSEILESEVRDAFLKLKINKLKKTIYSLKIVLYLCSQLWSIGSVVRRSLFWYHLITFENNRTLVLITHASKSSWAAVYYHYWAAAIISTMVNTKRTSWICQRHKIAYCEQIIEKSQFNMPMLCAILIVRRRWLRRMGLPVNHSPWNGCTCEYNNNAWHW